MNFIFSVFVSLLLVYYFPHGCFDMTKFSGPEKQQINNQEHYTKTRTKTSTKLSSVSSHCLSLKAKNNFSPAEEVCVDMCMCVCVCVEAI